MKDEIYKVLEEVEEPTLGIDIVNLGLVYEVCIKDDHDVEIVMATTSDDCMLSEYLLLSTKQALSKQIKDIHHIEIIIVNSPKWTKDRMTRYAKYILDL